MSNIHVFKFHRIHFDAAWKLLSLTDQIFTYSTVTKDVASIEVIYELPTGNVETAIIRTALGSTAIVHLGVLHLTGDIKISKGENL